MLLVKFTNNFQHEYTVATAPLPTLKTTTMTAGGTIPTQGWMTIVMIVLITIAGVPAAMTVAAVAATAAAMTDQGGGNHHAIACVLACAPAQWWKLTIFLLGGGGQEESCNLQPGNQI